MKQIKKPYYKLDQPLDRPALRYRYVTGRFGWLTKCYKNQIILSLLAAVYMTSCATTIEKGSDVTVSLTPHHDEYYTFFNKNENVQITNIIDNDGNLYVTRWIVSELEKEKFKSSKASCKKITGPWFFTGWPVYMDQITEKDMRPSNYKTFISCISSNGYKIKKSDGFLPKGYDIQISRTHSTSGQYLPVGGTIYIDGNSMKYFDVYNKLKSCDDKIKLRSGSPVVEQEFNGISYVSIESYVEELITCTTGKAYKINSKT